MITCLLQKTLQCSRRHYIVPSGLEYTHPDLQQNYEPKASADLNDNDDDPMPRYDISNENK